MQTILTLISLIVSLMTSGFVEGGAEVSPADPSDPLVAANETSSSQEGDDGELGPGIDPWG